jgi:membrane protein DedA with SNARE-associated domain
MIVNIISTTGLLYFLQMHGYAIMLVMMFVEGASVTYVSAFIASTGVFNIYAVLLISIFGFFVEDMILYFIGKYWGKKFLIKYFYSKSRGYTLKRLASGIKKHPGKTIAIVKLTPLIPVPGLIMTGASGVPVRKFVFYSLLISAIYSLTLSLLGYYSGMVLGVISKSITNSDWIIAVAIIMFIVIGYLSRFISRRVGSGRD